MKKLTQEQVQKNADLIASVFHLGDLAFVNNEPKGPENDKFFKNLVKDASRAELIHFKNVWWHGYNQCKQYNKLKQFEDYVTIDPLVSEKKVYWSKLLYYKYSAVLKATCYEPDYRVEYVVINEKLNTELEERILILNGRYKMGQTEVNRSTFIHQVAKLQEATAKM